MPSQVDIHLGLTPSPADEVDVLEASKSQFMRNGSAASGGTVAMWLGPPVAVVLADVRCPASTWSGPEVEDD